MSTKTTFKRIALVAVAALGLSLVAVVPSNAAAVGVYTPTITSGATTVTGTGTATGTATGVVGTAVGFNVVVTGSSTPTAADLAVTTPVLTGTATTQNGSKTAITVATLAAPTNTLVNMTSSTGLGVVYDTATATAAASATHLYAFTPDVTGTYIFTYTTVAGAGTLAATFTYTATAVAGNVYATNDANGASASSPTAAGIAGANNYVTVTQSVLSATAYNVVVTGSTATVVTAGATGTGTSSIVTPIATLIVLNIPTPTVGTITVKNYAITNGVQSATATSTVTITVAAAAIPATTYSASTAFISNVTGTDLAADGTTLTAASTSTGTAVGFVTVSQYATTSATTRLLDANSTAVTVTITGAGTVGSGATPASNRGPSTTVAAAAASVTSAGSTGVQNFSIYADGRLHTST